MNNGDQDSREFAYILINVITRLTWYYNNEISQKKREKNLLKWYFALLRRGRLTINLEKSKNENNEEKNNNEHVHNQGTTGRCNKSQKLHLFFAARRWCQLCTDFEPAHVHAAHHIKIPQKKKRNRLYAPV